MASHIQALFAAAGFGQPADVRTAAPTTGGEGEGGLRSGPSAGGSDLAVPFNLKDIIPALTQGTALITAGRGLVEAFKGPQKPPPALSLTATGGVLRGLGTAAGLTGLAIPFLGGNGEVCRSITVLEKAKAATGRRVTRRQLITAAKVCGMEVAAETFGLSVLEVCSVVAKGMPRRSRGISAADLRRTRSTIRKVSTIRKNLAAIARR